MFKINHLDNIKRKLHTANPIFTDEVLDLLYEYMNCRKKNSISENIENLKSDYNFKNIIQSIYLDQQIFHT